ncbi:hypothetical protein C7S18_04480 [Ahniella affigens]|uniref:Calcineurin-like phosphoesterase domain-containing protein n=1 Tax=Ahniella affigens TaxID=2021234 RepID=A0A2P1PNU8_9GAMM|nr:metallophosphoesterase [Ahniella affigens]AVP96497.1 hypothetical protein C7S18_04480 [Ahniella affigens]
MSNELRILHISDLHSAQRFSESGTKAHRDQQGSWRYLLEQLLDSLRQMENGDSQTFDLLVISGDITDRGQNDEFQDFADHFLRPLLSGKSFRYAVVVPGNHDVNWSIVRENCQTGKVGRSPLGGFKMAISDGNFPGVNAFYSAPTTPGQPPVTLKIPIGEHTCQIVPFNSVNLSGIPNPDVLKVLLHSDNKSENRNKGARSNKKEISQTKASEVPAIDPAVIAAEDLTNCRSVLSSLTSHDTQTFRIAVVHHNPIPFAHEAEDAKPYRFLNDGAFNDFLLENNFRLVLHGHQHQSRLVTLSDHSRRDGAASVGVDDSFMCLGAPAFGARHTPGNEIGFNIITLNFDVPGWSNALIKQVSRFDHPGQGLSRPTYRDIRQLIPIGKQSLKQREIHNKVSDILLRNDTFEVERLERFIDAQGDSEVSFFERVREIHSNLQNIRAMYSLSVFPPELWSEKRLAEFFLPEARRNIGRAAALAKSIESELVLNNEGVKRVVREAVPNLHFHFSEPLHGAIQNALRISKTLGVVSRLRNARDHELTRLGKRERSFFDRNVGRGTLRNTSHIDRSDSLSLWDNVPIVDGVDLEDSRQPNINDIDAVERALFSPSNTIFEEGMRVSISTFPWVPQKTVRPNERHFIANSLMEFPRILLWDDREFEKRTSLECIEFHENCGFPLFWMCPDTLLGRTGLGRRDIGHFTVFAKVRGESDERIRAQEDVWNDKFGNEPADWRGHLGASKIEWLWGIDAYPRHLGPGDGLVDEFVHLLRRPDIMFAADAWAMWQLGDQAWKNLKSELANQRLADWLLKVF